MRLYRVLTIMILLILSGLGQDSLGQRRGKRSPVRSQKSAASKPVQRGQAAELGTDGYWAAQRSIEAAIQQLEEYLRRSPDGEHTATARRQVAALKRLAISASHPEWVLMGERSLREVPEWRVSSVELQADKTRLTVEVTCQREDGGDCYFYAFDRNPLVLIDDAGRYYPMIEASPLPSDIKYRNGEPERAVLSGGRTITITVNFAPLAHDAASGEVYYRDNNKAKPARFSPSRKS